MSASYCSALMHHMLCVTHMSQLFSMFCALCIWFWNGDVWDLYIAAFHSVETNNNNSGLNWQIHHMLDWEHNYRSSGTNFVNLVLVLHRYKTRTYSTTHAHTWHHSWRQYSSTPSQFQILSLLCTPHSLQITKLRNHSHHTHQPNQFVSFTQINPPTPHSFISSSDSPPFCCSQ
jgi:hypothetical protein